MIPTIRKKPCLISAFAGMPPPSECDCYARAMPLHPRQCGDAVACDVVQARNAAGLGPSVYLPGSSDACAAVSVWEHTYRLPCDVR